VKYKKEFINSSINFHLHNASNISTTHIESIKTNQIQMIDNKCNKASSLNRSAIYVPGHYDRPDIET